MPLASTAIAPPVLVMPPRKVETVLIRIPVPIEDVIVPALVMPPRKVVTAKPPVPTWMPARPPEIKPVELLTMPPVNVVTPLTLIAVVPAASAPALLMPPVKVGPEIEIALLAPAILLALSIRMP